MPRFRAELERVGPGYFVVIPFDPHEAFGEARPPVRGTVSGFPRRPETREGRVAKAVEQIRMGKLQR